MCAYACVLYVGWGGVCVSHSPVVVVRLHHTCMWCVYVCMTHVGYVGVCVRERWYFIGVEIACEGHTTVCGIRSKLKQT